MRLISHFAAVFLALGVLGAADAQTGDRRPAARPAPPAPSERVQATGVQPARFLITALRLLANDETGNDHLGSDEIVVAFYDQVRRQQMATSVFGDFDTGETREFARGQACITPATDLNPNGARPTGLTRHGDLWRCDRAGAPGPVGVRVVVIEIDDWTPVACNVAIFTTFFTDRGARGSDSAQNTTGCSPDLVGSGFIRFSQGSLLRDLREAGASKEYALRLGGYTLTYRVRRVS